MDELLTTRPATGPMVGPAGHHPSGGERAPAEFEAAGRRLGRTAREVADRLEGRLQTAFERYDLGRDELMAAQRQVRVLRRAGLVPSPADYWEGTAVPRAEILVEASVDVVDEELDLLGEAIDRFLVATSRSTLEPWINGADGRAAIQRTGVAAIDRFLAAIPQAQAIDDLGEWWQRRLQRRAIVQSLPRLLVSRATVEAVIGERELALLDAAPWSHGDRLLSAFELGHAEIRNRAVGGAEELLDRVNDRGHGRLVEPGSGGPAVIKLTEPSS